MNKSVTEKSEHKRVPISHPDYRYSESTNPYSKKIETVADRVYSDQASEAFPGAWRSRFPNALTKPPGETLSPTAADHSGTASSKPTSERKTLHVEIGCNAGHVIIPWAQQNPDNNYIGIDWKFKPIFRAAEKSLKHKVDNVLLFRAHADRIQYMFGPGEIDFLYLFFPDPWPKKAQKKNRFIQPARLKEIHSRLADQGIFTIRTDHRDYFDWMIECIRQTQDLWDTLEISYNLYEHHPNPKCLKIPEVTLFEQLFIKDGLPIHLVRLRKKT